MSAHVVTADGIDMCYDVHGAGPASVFLVHGVAGCRHDWDAQIPTLAQHYQVVAVDLPGHGDSRGIRRPWRVTAFADDLVRLVTQVGTLSNILVGHSMGADVIGRAAAAIRPVLTGLVAVDGWSHLDANVWRPDQLAGLGAKLRADYGATMESWVASMFGPHVDRDTVAAAVERMADPARRELVIDIITGRPGHGALLAALSDRTLQKAAINSTLFARKDPEAFGEYGVEVVEMPNVGHFMMLESPHEFTATLLGIIDTMTRRHP